MKIKLILQRTAQDGFSAWSEYKEISVEIPLQKQDGWQVAGAIWNEGGCGMSEEWNELVTEAQAHIATKDKLAELTVENETLRNRCAELSTEVVSAWGQNGMLKEKHNVVKRQRDIYRKNWQEYKYIKFELEGHSGWLFKQNEELKQAGDEMAKRLCQIINSEKFSDDASVSAVALWFKAKGENSNE